MQVFSYSSFHFIFFSKPVSDLKNTAKSELFLDSKFFAKLILASGKNFVL